MYTDWIMLITKTVKLFFSRSSYNIFWLAVMIFLSSISSVIFAQAQETSFSFSTRFPVVGETVLDGYIVANTESGYAVTTEAYQQNQSGVVTERPAIEIGTEGENETTYPIATNGDALVWVSLSNGEIKKGDPITSSPFAGIGMKATSPGPILGIALIDVAVPDNGADLDQIITKVRVAINPTNENKINNSIYNNSTRQSPAFSTSSLIRFGVGALIIISTIFISLNFFGKLSRSGVEAIGRNPLAFKKIEFGITINIVVGFLIAIIGIAVAVYLIN